MLYNMGRCLYPLLCNADGRYGSAHMDIDRHGSVHMNINGECSGMKMPGTTRAGKARTHARSLLNFWKLLLFSLRLRNLRDIVYSMHFVLS